MNEIADYFSAIPSSHRALIIAGGIAFFWLFEAAAPLSKLSYRKWHHAGINIFFTFTTIVVNFILAFLLLMTANWTDENRFGILHWLPAMPLWLDAIVGLLLLDLIGAYFAHVVQHKTKLLWRFHLIHHTDTWIDATSANRHHPGESVVRFLFTT
ncbi:MAG: sterol desaturase, partial [Flavobacterium sp.]